MSEGTEDEAGFCSRKVLVEGLQQDLYDFIIKKTKELVFDELTDLLAEASWMSAYSRLSLFQWRPLYILISI